MVPSLSGLLEPAQHCMWILCCCNQQYNQLSVQVVFCASAIFHTSGMYFWGAFLFMYIFVLCVCVCLSLRKSFASGL